MEEVKTAVEVAGQMSQATMLWIMGALVTVITTLGGIVTAQYNKRANPLNGTLVRVDSTLRQLNTTMAEVGVRTKDSSRILSNHTEKLVAMGASVTQLAVNEAEQTRALLSLKPAIETSLTGCAARITGHCDKRSGAIMSALDKR